MIIPCPQCRTRLNLPENVEGKLVRCPNCKEVIRATREVLAESVQAGRPKTAPTALKRKPVEDDADDDRPTSKPRPRSRGYDDDEDDRAGDRVDLERRASGHDIDEIVANAKAHSRPAGYVMLAAAVFTALNVFVNLALSVVGHFELGGGPVGELVAETIAGVAIFAVPVIFMTLGGRGLLTLGQRGFIITAIVMNFLLLLVLGGFAAFNIVVLASGIVPIPPYLVLPTVVMNSISCVCNLGAAVLAIRVLMLAEVTEAYDAQSEEMRRRY